MQIRSWFRVIAGGIILAASAIVAMSTATAANVRPRQGGTVTFGAYSAITTLMPVGLPGGGVAGGIPAEAVYGSLTTWNPKKKAEVPYLAKSVTHNAKDTVWTIGLYPGMTFSDGSPFDAAAVKENFEWYMHPPAALQEAPNTLLDSFVQSVTTPTDTTVVVTLGKPWASFSTVLELGLYIAAPAYIAEADGGNRTATPIGAGPFVVSSFVPDSSLTLSANTHFYFGRPYLDTLKFVTIPGGAATLQAYQSGELQAAIIRTPLPVHQLVQAHDPHFSFFDLLANTLLINERAGSVLANPTLRKAVAMSINTRLYDERVYQGYGNVTDQVFPRGSEWYNAAFKGVAYDPAKAKKIVEQVKKTTGWNGTVNFACSDTPAEAAIPVAVASMLDPVGFHVTYSNSLNEGQFIEDVIVQHNYDLACWGMDVPDPDPFEFLYNYLTTGSPANFGAYSSAAMASVLNELRTATTAKAEKAGLEKFSSVWNASTPEVDLGTATETVVHSPSLHGVVPTQFGIVKFTRAWIS